MVFLFGNGHENRKTRRAGNDIICAQAHKEILFPKAALAMNQVKLSYYDLLHSGYSERITKAVLTIVPVILEKMPEVKAFIDAQNFLADIRKCFYKKILEARAEYLLKPAYERCVKEDFDQEAFERIRQKKAYSEEPLKTVTGHTMTNSRVLSHYRCDR